MDQSVVCDGNVWKQSLLENLEKDTQVLWDIFSSLSRHPVGQFIWHFRHLRNPGGAPFLGPDSQIAKICPLNRLMVQKLCSFVCTLLLFLTILLKILLFLTILLLCLFPYLAARNLSCGMQDLRSSCGTFPCSSWLSSCILCAPESGDSVQGTLLQCPGLVAPLHVGS